MKPNKNLALQGEVSTLSIDKKLRARDILETLCKDIGIDPNDIDKINIQDIHSYVATMGV